MANFVYGVVCAVLGCLIGMAFTYGVYKKAIKELARRFAILMRSHGVPLADMKLIMEVGYGDDKTLFDLAVKMRDRVASGRAPEGTVAQGASGNSTGKG
jgi:ketopantoate reductase